MVKKIIVILLICLGIFLRIYQFNSLPEGLFIDEINMAVDVKTLVENGTDQYGNSYPFTFEDVTDYKLPVYIYLSAIMEKLFGPELFTVRIVALLASIATIFSVGFLAKLLFPKRKDIANYTMVVLALSPFAIHFARIGYETTLATLFLSLFLIGVYKSVTKDQTKQFFMLAAVSALLAAWTYPAPRFIIPVFLVGLLIYSLVLQQQRQKQRKLQKNVLGLLAVCMLSFIPPIIFSNVANKRSLAYLLQDTSGGSANNVLGNKISSIVSSWLRLWNFEFLFDKGDTFAYRHGTKEMGIFESIFIIPYAIAIFAWIKAFRFSNFPLIFLLLFAIVAGLPSALTSSTPYGTRIVPMLIPFSILIGYGLNQIQTYLGKKNYAMKILLYTSCLVILLYQVALFAHIYFIHFKVTSQPEFSKAQVELGRYIHEEMVTDPNRPVYFLDSKTCRTWGFDAYYLWYFANLPNPGMIKWNNKYRQIRYNNSFHQSPFDAYDSVVIPTSKIQNLVLFPGNTPLPPHALQVHCGYNISSINPKTEQIKKIFYMYEDQQREPFYIITEKLR